MKKFFFALIICIFYSSVSLCAELSLIGNACETLRGEEKKSLARMRATDKALYNAVENVNEIFKLKSDLTEHDFNVFVYDVVDNNVLDLMVKTTKTNDLEVCVEASGYINLEEIAGLDVKKPEVLVEAKTLPEDKLLLYVAPTFYYNNTHSKSASEKIVKNFENGDGFYITDKPDISDYKLYPKVLKAKIEPVNDQLKRLHMVVNLELENQINKDVISEHQNKFVLINEGEDEQQKAQELMQKMFKAASYSVLNRLETIVYKKNQNKAPELLNAAQ